MASILLVEDHMVVRNGIKLLLESQTDFDVWGEASNGEEALKLITSKGVPDLVLTDINMEGGDGLELLETVKEKYPKLKVVILSMLNQLEYVIKGFDKGLSGYLVKNVGYEELLFGLRHISAGGKYISEELVVKLLDNAKTNNHYQVDQTDIFEKFDITEREMEVLRLIAEGYTNLEIADKIFLSKRTIEGHRQNLIDKANVKNTAELVKFAFQNGLLQV